MEQVHITSDTGCVNTINALPLNAERDSNLEVFVKELLTQGIITGKDITDRELFISRLTEYGTTPVDDNAIGAKLSAFVSTQLIDQWFPNGESVFINCAPGSGKSTMAWIANFVNNKTSVELVTFRSQIEDIAIEYFRNTGNFIKDFVSLKSLHETTATEIRMSTSVVSYQSVILQAWVSDLYGKKFSTDEVDELRVKVLDFCRDKVVFIDEADYMLTMIRSETTREYNHALGKVVRTKDTIVNEKIQALEELYKAIKAVAKRIIFMSATTSEGFNYILEAMDAKTIDPEFLEQAYYERENRNLRLLSVNMASATLIQHYDFPLNSSINSSDVIVFNEIMKAYSNPLTRPAKTLLYNTSIGVIRTANIMVAANLLGLKVLIITTPKKLRKGWTLHRNEDGELRKEDTNKNILENFKFNVDKHVSAKLGKNNSNAVGDFSVVDSPDHIHKHLSDETIKDYDIILVTTSSARAISLLSCANENVIVITDVLPTNTEAVQSSFRFRLANVHVIYITDLSHEFTNEGSVEEKSQRILSQLREDFSEKHYLQNKHVACIEETTRWSNTTPYQVVATDYLENILTYASTPDALKVGAVGKAVGRAKKALGQTNKAAKLIAFLKANPTLTQVQLIQLWKDTYPEEKVVSSTTITKWKKLINEGKV